MTERARRAKLQRGFSGTALFLSLLLVGGWLLGCGGEAPVPEQPRREVASSSSFEMPARSAAPPASPGFRLGQGSSSETESGVDGPAQASGRSPDEGLPEGSFQPAPMPDVQKGLKQIVQGAVTELAVNDLLAEEQKRWRAWREGEGQ